MDLTIFLPPACSLIHLFSLGNFCWHLCSSVLGKVHSKGDRRDQPLVLSCSSRCLNYWDQEVPSQIFSSRFSLALRTVLLPKLSKLRGEEEALH